jgi:hypothetical protein
VTALAHDLAGLIGPLHGYAPVLRKGHGQAWQQAAGCPRCLDGAETARKGHSLAGHQADGRLRRGRNRVRPYRSKVAPESIKRPAFMAPQMIFEVKPCKKSVIKLAA